VVLTENGVILETAFSNIFWISGDSIYHPHPSLPFYDGSGFQSFLKFVSSAANTALPQFQAHPGFYTIKDIPEDAKIFRISSYVFDPIVELGDRTFTRDLNLEATIKEEYFKWKVETGVNLLSYNSTI
jgi:branched-subunit amino acid aminotransferase/4-amino-4-deoxychorismate lyase